MLFNREPYKTLFKIFTFFGLWDEISIRQKCLTFYLPFCLLLIYQSLIFLSLFQTNTLGEKIKALQLLAIQPWILTDLVTFKNFKKNLNKLVDLIDTFEDDNPKVSIYIDKACKTSQMTFKIVQPLMIGTCLFLGTVPLIFGKLIVPLYTPNFREFQSIYFYFANFLEFMGAFFVCYTVGLLFQLRVSFLVVLYQFMKFFSENLQNDKTSFEKIKRCAKYHLQLQRIMEIFIEANAVSLYLYVYSSTLTLVSVVFIMANMTDEGKETLAFFMIFLLFVLNFAFVPYYFGSIIETHSEKFINDLFASDWYESDLKIQKMVVIMMENMKKPIKLRAFGFDAINLDGFLKDHGNFIEANAVSLYFFVYSSTLTLVSVVFIMANMTDEGKETLAFLMIFLLFMLNLAFIPYYFGSIIETHSEKFINDLYASDWYDSDLKIQKMVVIMMENMKKPIQLRAFGFDAINLEGFLKIMKFVYSMYSVIKNMI
ncbi:hypothetical protein PVAND_008598 [Polypedilum vanderplanki]|uniref:Odorant receptor n=1 Tax=Polypedilum vanderplanki TaxID=319348 RepID=A0A9J6CA33_POLVA|nr:hypothetical protein PVAND_008598 [Polypedilum vanderplanki]